MHQAVTVYQPVPLNTETLMQGFINITLCELLVERIDAIVTNAVYVGNCRSSSCILHSLAE